MITRISHGTQSSHRMGYLLVPALNNHFQTLQLFALAQKKGGSPYMLAIKTDKSADGAIRKLAHEQGITLLTRNQALDMNFDRVYVHAWTHDPTFLESIQFEELFVYADGLSNRLRKDRLPDVSGYVFWGEEVLKDCDWNAIAPGVEIELVSATLIKSQWMLLAQVMQISSQYLNEVVGSPDLLIAFRYWGASIYFGLGLAETKNYIGKAIKKAKRSGNILVAPDFRWDLRIAQIDLVKEIAEGSQVSELLFPRDLKKKLGHLCTLDLLAFNSKTIGYQVVAFDGSATLTYLLSAESTRVPIVIQPEFQDVLPGERLVSENISSHLEIIEKGGLSSKTMLNLMRSDTLSEAISFGSRVLNEEERSLVVNRFLRDYRGTDTAATLANWLRTATNKRTWAANLKGKLRSGKLARRIFYWGFTNSIAKKLIQTLKKVFF